MKTIEDRVDIWGHRMLLSNSHRKQLKNALTELAADLQAEKEKEVAELKTAIQELSNSKVSGDQRCAKYIGEIAELQAWKESALQVMPDFHKLGKLLGLPLGSSVSEQLVPSVEKLTKEVAELKEKLATLATDYSEVVAGESEMEELTKLRALLDEVKRVLAMAENRALDWDMLGRAHGNSAVQMWREDALKLLTRLGGTANE